MALVIINQNILALSGGTFDRERACGVACVLSVLRSLGVNPFPQAETVFTAIQTVSVTRAFGSTPANIANYLHKLGQQVRYFTHNVAHSPITTSLELGLHTSKANRVKYANLVTAPGGPPYLIHFLKIKGALEAEGHYVVSDGQQYMDPGHNSGEIVNHLPNWKSFYDTGLTVVVG
jgi:hypothetical protein